eukprot:gene25784-29129_t
MEVRNVSISVDSVYSQLLYYELYFRYVHEVGSCAKWNQFRHSAEVTRFLTIRNVETISVTTIKQLYDYYLIADQKSDVVTCHNSTIAKQIVRRLSGETNENVDIRCGPHDWKFRNCRDSFPALCIDCEDPCIEHCSNERYVNFISPCRSPDVCTDAVRHKRNGIINSIHLLSVTSSDRYPAPDVRNISISTTKKSVTANITLADRGGFYCGAFPYGYVPTSLDEIRFQNKLARVGASASGSLFVDNLIPATKYSLYCFTFSVTESSMSYKQMLSRGVVHFTTDCCKTITVALKSVHLLADTNHVNTLSIAADWLPSANVTVEVVAMRKNKTAGVFFPNKVTFSSNSASATAFLSLSTTGMAAGVYRLHATVTGPSVHEYSV